MIIEHTSVLSRLIGVGVCVFSTWLAGCLIVFMLAGAAHMDWWMDTLGFGLIGWVAWSLTRLGEWFWSFEEGWFGLQRGFRLIQMTLICGGLACDLAFRVAHCFQLV
jgi:hypothetical protein